MEQPIETSSINNEKQYYIGEHLEGNDQYVFKLLIKLDKLSYTIKTYEKHIVELTEKINRISKKLEG